MRKLVQLVVFALFMGSGVVFAQYITAEDNAGNYSTWSHGSNQGFGFANWNIYNSSGASAGVFLGSSHLSLINSGGQAFGSWASSGYVNMERYFSNPLNTDQIFYIELSVHWRDGNRGIDIFNSSGTSIFNFDISNSGYSSTGWGWYDNSAIRLTITQTGAGTFTVAAYRLNDASTWSSGSLSGQVAGFKAYVGNTGGGSERDFFINNLKIETSNPSAVPETADVKINGIIELDSDKSLTVNNLTITSGNSFTLKSLATGTASLITTGNITGNVTIERYLTGGWDWHLLSSPVVDQTIAGPTNFIAFTFGTEGNKGDPDVDFFRYDETAISNPWVNIKGEDGTLNTNFGTPSSNPFFEEGQGYLVSYHTETITKSFVGVPFTGGLFIPLTYTEAGSKGWNLVGNPYPSAIDWDAGIITKTNLFNEYYYIYNQEMNSGGGGYEYFSTSMAGHSDGVNGDIPAMQAFFVKAASEGGSLTLSNNARKHSTQPFLKDELNNSNLLELKLQGTTYFGKSQIFLSETAEVGVDSQDAFMLFSMNDEVPQVFCQAGTDRLVLNSVPLPNNEILLPLGIKVGNTGPFTLTSDNIADFNTNYAVLLEDLQENLIIDLRQNPSYTFTTNNGGIHNNRFVLHLKTGVGIDESATAVQPLVVVRNHELTVYNLTDGLYKLQLTDVAGRLLFTGNYQSGESLLLPASFTTGVCLVQLTSHRNAYVQKVVIQ